jgi:hypothetical protein
MADMLVPVAGVLRASDSWSTTEIRTANHTHVWTVKGFSQCDCRYLETTVKVDQTAPNYDAAAAAATGTAGTSANNEPISFRIRLHPQGNKESNKDFTFFQVFCNALQMKYRAKFTVYNATNEEVSTTVSACTRTRVDAYVIVQVYTGTQQLHGYFEYIRRDALLAHIAPADELHLMLALTITYDTVTKSSQTSPQPPAVPQPKLTDVAADFEQLYNDIQERPHLNDFKVSVVV